MNQRGETNVQNVQDARLCRPHPLVNVLDAHQVAVLLRAVGVGLMPCLRIAREEVTFALVLPPALLTLAAGWKHKHQEMIHPMSQPMKDTCPLEMD